MSGNQVLWVKSALKKQEHQVGSQMRAQIYSICHYLHVGNSAARNRPVRINLQLRDLFTLL